MSLWFILGIDVIYHKALKLIAHSSGRHVSTAHDDLALPIIRASLPHLRLLMTKVAVGGSLLDPLLSATQSHSGERLLCFCSSKLSMCFSVSRYSPP